MLSRSIIATTTNRGVIGGKSMIAARKIISGTAGAGQQQAMRSILVQLQSVSFFTTDDSLKHTHTKQQKQKPKKENFAKKYLDPAARGELTKKHTTGIPKLAIRKPKGHATKDDFPGKESQRMLDALDDAVKNATHNDNNNPVEEYDNSGTATTTTTMQTPSSTSTSTTREKYVDYDDVFKQPTYKEINPHLVVDSGIEYLGIPKNQPVVKSRLFQFQRNLKHQGGVGGRGGRGGGGRGGRGGGGRGGRGGRGDFGGRGGRALDIWGDVISKRELEEGEEPSPYMSYSHHNPHIESKRHPRPIVYPAHRVNPPMKFVRLHKAFCYVSNIPTPVIMKEEQDGGKKEVVAKYDNPDHRAKVAKFVHETMDVPLNTIHVSSMNSAFVGFNNATHASRAYNSIGFKRMIQLETSAKLLSGNSYKDVKEFNLSSSSPDCIIEVSKLPGGMRPGTIVKLLQNIIDLDVKNVHFVTPTKALIKLPSTDEAKSLLHNDLFNNAIQKVSKHTLHVQPAKREVIFDKFWSPANVEQNQFTDRLVVDGDLPSTPFFLSHAAVLHLSHVDANITKEDISNFFQEYCAQQRHVSGSIEIVKSLGGHPTGRVYVGFDLQSECDRAWKAIKSSGNKIVLNDSGQTIRAKPLKERGMVRGKKLGERTQRSEEELLACLKTSWQDHVDPTDIDLLESMGISRDVLEDAFLAARYNNPTFGTEGLAREGERLNNTKKPGQEYSDFVKLYVETLKELGATRENPGDMFKAMFLPNEEIEYSLFDEEEERLAKVKEERNKLV
jgi:uncharacterized membrane protein YgcG